METTIRCWAVLGTLALTLGMAVERAHCQHRLPPLTPAPTRAEAASQGGPGGQQGGGSRRESPQELRPGVGERFLAPPSVPPAPEGLTEARRAASAATTPLTLDVVQSLACRSNPTLTQARAQVQGELGKAIQAGLWPNPTLIYMGEQFGLMGTAGEWQGAMVEQRIVTARKLDLSRAKFLARTRAAEWRALEQQYQVLNDIRIHFFIALARQEIVGVRRELLKNAEDAVVTAGEQYNAGQATRARVHQANVALQKDRLELLMATNRYQEAFQELTALAGVNLPLAPLEGPLEGPVSPIEWDQALVRLLAESPELLAARTKLESDRIQVKRETVEFIPDVVVAAGVGRNFEAEDTTATVELRMEVPVFDWNQGTIRQAEADLARQQAEIQRIELALRRELARVYQRYLTAMQHVRNYQDVILPEARAAYEVLLDGYQDDRARWVDVLDAERGYFQLREEYFAQLMEWRTNEVLIAGYLLHNGLMAPTGPEPPGHITATPKPR